MRGSNLFSPFRFVLVVAALLQGAPALVPVCRASTPGQPAIVIGPGTHVTIAPTTRFSLDCDLTAHGVFSPSPGSRVVVRGFGAPVLRGVDRFADLELALHGTAALGDPATVAGTLRLGGGRLSLAGCDLFANAVVGGSATSYVVTPDTLGRLVRPVDELASTFFPVGAASYDPVAARPVAGKDTLRVAVLDAPSTVGLVADASLARAWAIAATGGTGGSAAIDLDLQWNDGEQGPAYDRAVGGAGGALAWRWNGVSWAARPGVLTGDNGVFPAVATLTAASPGLWTLADPAGPSAVASDLAPATLQFAPVWPNPLRDAATVSWGLPRRGRVSVDVYSVRGERIATLVSEDQDAGWHSTQLDTRRIASGVYFLRLQAGGRTVSKKVVVVR